MRCFHGLRARGGVAGLLLLNVGCVTTTFVATDGRSAAGPSRKAGVYRDQLPSVPFASVGLIEVKARAVWPHEDIVAEAAQKAGEVGCDFLIARTICGETGCGLAPAERAPPISRQFVCGVAQSPTATPFPGVFIAPEPRPGPGVAHVAVPAEVRTAPTSTAPILMVLAIGQPLQIVGDARNGWAAARLPDGRIGYLPFTALAFDPPR